MKLKHALTAAVIAGLAVFGSTVPATAQDDEVDTIAVIPLSLGHPWWVRAEEGAQRAAEELGIEVIFTAPEREDAGRQLDVFNDMVNRGVDAIVVAGVDPETLRRPISRAIDDGIPVFGFDIGVPGTDVLFTASGWEAQSSGTNIGEGLAEEIGGEGKVAILTGGLGSPLLAERQAAIEAALAEYPGIEVVGVYASDNDFAVALSQAESVLQAHPDLAGFASTVTTGVPAAVQATVNAGVQGDVSIWGVAMPQQNAEAVNNGWVNGALALDSGQMTYLGVMMAYRYLTEGTLPEQGDEFGWAGQPVINEDEGMAYVPDTLLTPENVGDFPF
jgi:ABC-type sugar transport system substrate-binding protein